MIDEVKSGSAQLLDVRRADEWQSGHAEHAIHIPVDDLLQGAIGPLMPSKKIYVYCLSGGRAGRAATYLQSQGFQAENADGLADWLRAGGTLAKS
ncbi:rhodanese-like domain-containing protein [Candidatus Kaiserbacteria bacterium]|nr:rhodanese-like domain-containing protein [Candidatus Kaiserbacteria bacterium]